MRITHILRSAIVAGVVGGFSVAVPVLAHGGAIVQGDQVLRAASTNGSGGVKEDGEKTPFFRKPAPPFHWIEARRVYTNQCGGVSLKFFNPETRRTESILLVSNQYSDLSKWRKQEGEDKSPCMKAPSSGHVAKTLHATPAEGNFSDRATASFTVTTYGGHKFTIRIRRAGGDEDHQNSHIEVTEILYHPNKM